MIILQSKTKHGKSKELIKRFITDKEPARLISDELSLQDFSDIVEILKQEGFDINNSKMKNIETVVSRNLNGDFNVESYSILKNRFTQNLYLDIHVPSNTLRNIKQYCKELEKGQDNIITLIEQLPAYSDIKGVNIIEDFN